MTTRRGILKIGATTALAATAGAMTAGTASSAGTTSPSDRPYDIVDRAALQAGLDQIVATGGASGALAEVRGPGGVWRGAGGIADIIGHKRRIASFM